MQRWPKCSLISRWETGTLWWPAWKQLWLVQPLLGLGTGTPVASDSSVVVFLLPLLISCWDMMGNMAALQFNECLNSFAFFFHFWVPPWSYISITCKSRYLLGSEPGLTPSQKLYHKTLRLLGSAFVVFPGCTLHTGIGDACQWRFILFVKCTGSGQYNFWSCLMENIALNLTFWLNAMLL